MDKANTCARCVYTSPEGLCPGTSALHPKEHPLPAGLGSFKGDVRLRGFICYECQTRFGKFEEVFLRNGTEAFFRRILGVQGRKGHDGKNIFVEPTLGLPPLTVKALHPNMGHELLWEVTPQELAFPVHQLVFKATDGTIHQIPIREGKLLNDLSQFGDSWKSWQLLVCIASSAQEPELQSVLGPALNGMSSAPLDAAENAQIEAEMKAQISVPYVRAISKIAFHFVLAHFHFTGLEGEFDDLKRFIYLGVGTSPARKVDDVLLPQLVPEEARLRDWSHIVTAEFNRDGFFSRMQFFAGPRLKPFVWRVHLGANPSRILTEKAQGIRYYYYQEPDPSGYSGGVEELKLGPKLVTTL